MIPVAEEAAAAAAIVVHPLLDPMSCLIIWPSYRVVIHSHLLFPLSLSLLLPPALLSCVCPPQSAGKGAAHRVEEEQKEELCTSPPHSIVVLPHSCCCCFCGPTGGFHPLGRLQRLSENLITRQRYWSVIITEPPVLEDPSVCVLRSDPARWWWWRRGGRCGQRTWWLPRLLLPDGCVVNWTDMATTTTYH